MSKHRVKIMFGDPITARLICPESGCEPGEGSELDNECWIKSWFDNCTAEELLGGTIEVPFHAEADEGGPTFTVTAATQSLRSGVEGEIKALRHIGGMWGPSTPERRTAYYRAGCLQAILDEADHE